MSAHFRYLRYVLAHKWFVFVAGLRTGAPIWRLLVHDWSKFLPSEWFPYVRNFYGTFQPQFPPYYGPVDTQRVRWETWKRERFDQAWLLHQNRHPHHWQFWVLINDNDVPQERPLPIPDHFIREMVADWAGAGRAITGRWDLPKWYAANRDKQQIHPESRTRVDELVRLFDGAP